MNPINLKEYPTLMRSNHYTRRNPMSTYVTKRAAELGVKVVDATAPLMLEVKQSDIDRAVPKNSKVCAFARACERAMPVEAAFFFKSTAWLEYKDKIVRYRLPNSMQKEIVSFDRSRQMEPGVYRLSAIGKNKTLKAKAKERERDKAAKRSHQGAGKLRRTEAFRHKTTNVRGLFDPSYRAAKD